MRAFVRLCAACALLAIILPGAPPASAQGAFVLMNGRNHPELAWMEMRTEHFRIFYHAPLEAWALKAASILERYHGPLCRKLDVVPGAPTRIYLSDQDQIANAAAIGWDYIFVWIPSHPALATFSGSRPWLEEVLVHEYTHILVSWASRTWIGNLAFLLGLYPPRWVHEGIAQWTAEPWSVFRGDETIAGAILDGSLDRNPPGTPGEGRLLYARGNARIRWLAASLGDSAIDRLIRPAGRFGLYGYPSSERRAAGKESDGLWDRFRKSMISFYGARYRRGESPDSIGTPTAPDLAFPARVVFGKSGVSWWTGQARRGAGEASLFRREGSSGRQRRIVEGWVTGRPIPLADGRCLISRFHRVAHGSWVEDLGVWDPRGGFRFLTHGERIGEADTLAGEGLVTVADSPLHPEFLRTVIPARGATSLGAARATPIPEVAGLYDLAVSPTGDRLVFSAVEPDGRRSLWGTDIGGSSTATRLLTGDRDERESIWLDPERIAWISHRSGVAELRSGLWPRGSDRLESDSARTSVGAGLDICGRRGDSLLVLDRSSRTRTRVIACDPKRRPLRPLEGSLYPFPARAAVDPDTTARPSIAGPFPYRPLNEVRPWLLLPLIGPQGGDLGIGGLGLWAEPLLRDAWGGIIYGNANQARNPDRALFYLTSRVGPWISCFNISANLPRRVLEGRLLYERREETGIAILAPLASSADPNIDGWVDASIGDLHVHPRGGAFRTPIGAPRNWSSLTLRCGGGMTRIPPDGAGGAGVRRGVGASGSVEVGVAPSRSETRFFRCSTSAFLARPIRLPSAPTLWIEGESRGTSGDLPPQEYEGLDRNPSIEPIPGWPGIGGSIFLRGYPHARAGRLVLRAAVEIRIPILPDLGLRAYRSAVGEGTIAPFIEAAHRSGAPGGRFLDEPAIVTCGGEGRFAARIGPFAVLPAIAWGRPFSGRFGGSGAWAFRLLARLPFVPPLRPPSLFRSLIGGALSPESLLPIR